MKTRTFASRKTCAFALTLFCMALVGCTNETHTPEGRSAGNTSGNTATTGPTSAGGGNTGTTGTPAGKTFTIGMSQCNLGEPWRVQMNKDIEEAAAKHSEIKLISLDAQNKSETQQ